MDDFTLSWKGGDAIPSKGDDCGLFAPLTACLDATCTGVQHGTKTRVLLPVSGPACCSDLVGRVIYDVDTCCARASSILLQGLGCPYRMAHVWDSLALHPRSSRYAGCAADVGRGLQLGLMVGGVTLTSLIGTERQACSPLGIRELLDRSTAPAQLLRSALRQRHLLGLRHLRRH